jgi:hypothetical protein
VTEVTAYAAGLRENEQMSPPGRRQSLIFPREHGAWGILLVPLFTGGSVGLLAGGRAGPLAPLTIAVLALFWLRTPLENWMGTVPTKARTAAELKLVRAAALILAAISAGALSWLFWNGQNRELLWIGAIALAAFAAQAFVRQARRKARTAAQMAGAAGLTAVAPTAYFVVAGRLNGAAWPLWLLNFAFAANQIQFVQLRIRASHVVGRAEKFKLGRKFMLAQVILIAFLLAGCAARLWTWYAAAAFAPVLWRGFAWFVSPFQPLAVHTLGKRELMHAMVFGALLILAFAVS